MVCQTDLPSLLYFELSKNSIESPRKQSRHTFSVANRPSSSYSSSSSEETRGCPDIDDDTGDSIRTLHSCLSVSLNLSLHTSLWVQGKEGED